MANNPSNPSMVVIISIVAFLLLSLHGTEAKVGVCYNDLTNELPPYPQVLDLYESNGIQSMRMYDPDPGFLPLLNVQGKKMTLMVGVPREDIQSLASDQSAATHWVKTNVVPYAWLYKYIAVGNEILSTDPEGPSVLPAMQNIHNALVSTHLDDKIKISTTIETNQFNSYPPSNAEFKDLPYMTPIIKFLVANGSPLLVNVFTYFSYRYDKFHCTLDYALFTSKETVVTDHVTGLNYQNLFDAKVDSVYAALKKVGAPNTTVVVSETGWPSYGDDGATVENARTYYRNVIKHVSQGTPLKPRQEIETFLYSLFDEDQKQGDEEFRRHFGIFNPNRQSKYGELKFT